MASKWPQRPNITSELKSIAPNFMLVLTVMAFLWPDFQLCWIKIRKTTTCRPAAAGKN